MKETRNTKKMSTQGFEICTILFGENGEHKAYAAKSSIDGNWRFFMNEEGEQLCPHAINDGEFFKHVESSGIFRHCPKCDYEPKMIDAVLGTGGALSRFISSNSDKLYDTLKKVESASIAQEVYSKIDSTIKKAVADFKPTLVKKVVDKDEYIKYASYLWKVASIRAMAVLKTKKEKETESGREFKQLYEIIKKELEKTESSFKSSINKQINATLLGFLGLDKAKSVLEQQLKTFEKISKEQDPSGDILGKAKENAEKYFGEVQKEVTYVDKKGMIKEVVMISTFISLFVNVSTLSSYSYQSPYFTDIL